MSIRGFSTIPHILNRLAESNRHARFLSSIPSSSSGFYDIVIVGGGLVGNAMACSIGLNDALKSHRVLLIESGKPKSLGTPPPEYSNRVSAISPASIRLFKDLGIWDRLKQYRTSLVTDLYVLDSCSRSNIRFERLNQNDEIAYIVENDAITSSLYDVIQERCPNVTICSGTSLKNCTLPNGLTDHVSLTLSDESSIRTSLIIGADGQKSRVREAMGVEYTGWNYEQMGLVATLRISTDLSNTIAWQRFTPFGPIALLPLSQECSSLVWTTTIEDAKRLLALSQDQFIDELNHYLHTDAAQNAFTNQTLFLLEKIGSTLCNFREADRYVQPPTVISLQSDTRAAFPLGFGHASEYVKTRCALIGDAAHRVHPLAGQGVNLGWSDVQILTRTLEKIVRDGADLGSLTYLTNYGSESQRKNVPKMVAIDWLNRLYRTDFEPIVFIRSLGLSTVDKLLPLKDLIIYTASK